MQFEFSLWWFLRGLRVIWCLMIISHVLLRGQNLPPHSHGLSSFFFFCWVYFSVNFWFIHLFAWQLHTQKNMKGLGDVQSYLLLQCDQLCPRVRFLETPEPLDPSHHLQEGKRRKRLVMNWFFRKQRITRGFSLLWILRRVLLYKMCSSHQSLDWEPFDIAWGKGIRGGDVEEVLLVCLYVHMCVCEGDALEHVFYLFSHGCHCDGSAGAAVAHGNQISLCILDLMWKHHGGLEE